MLTNFPIYGKIQIAKTSEAIKFLRNTKMALNLEKLSKFDLEKDLEMKLVEDKKRDQFFNFMNTLFEIQIADRFIRECPSFPRSTQEIIRRELSSAVGATLAIEGTTLREEEIEQSFQKADLKKKLKDKEQEAQNSRNAYKYIIEQAKERKGSFIYKEEHIKKIHQFLTKDIECVSPNVPGQYREMIARFGEPRKTSFCKKKSDIERIMKKFINWLNEKRSGILSGNPITKAIMAHYYLTEIHPFGDGNGRTARAVEALVLYANGINTYCFWSLANFWSANRDKYLVYLGDVRATCDPWEFLVWGTEGYLQEVKRTKNLVLIKVKELMLQDYVRWLYSKKKINQRVYGVLVLIIRTGKMPFNKFLSSPELTTLYSNRKISTRYKDFDKMRKTLNLIRIFKEGHQKFIEPNFQELEELEYSV